MPSSISSSPSCERRPSRGRHGTARQSHAHRATGLVHRSGQSRKIREWAPFLGGRTDQLFEQHRHTDPAPTRGIERVLDGDIVIDHDAVDRNAGFRRREFGRHLEVHHVAGVVLHNVQHPSARIDGPWSPRASDQASEK